MNNLRERLEAVGKTLAGEIMKVHDLYQLSEDDRCKDFLALEEALGGIHDELRTILADVPAETPPALPPEGHTPGPWKWKVFGGVEWVLWQPTGTRFYVMDFVRKGMQGATPRVRREPQCIMTEFDPDHPDARLIAMAPELAAENARLREELARLKPAETPPTLEELRASAGTKKEFLLCLNGEMHLCTIEKCVARKDHYWVHTQSGGVTSLPDILPLRNWQFAECPRICDTAWTTVETTPND